MIDRSHIAQGERLRDEGLKLAADAAPDRVTLGRVRMLRAMIGAADRTATIDDATPPDEIATGYADGGYWRGQVPRSLATEGVIEATGNYRPSIRPSAHRRPNAVWRLIDLPRALAYISLASHALDTNDATPAAGTTGADSSNSQQTTKQGNLNHESI